MDSAFFYSSSSESPLTVEDLEPDVLVNIMERVNPRDLQRLHLVSKTFRAAVRDARFTLMPCRDLEMSELLQVCRLFPNATALDLTSWWLLKNKDLADLRGVLPGLKRLLLSHCNWLGPVGLGHVAAISQLEVSRTPPFSSYLSITFSALILLLSITDTLAASLANSLCANLVRRPITQTCAAAFDKSDSVILFLKNKLAEV